MEHNELLKENLEWYLKEHNLEDVLQALKETNSHEFLALLAQYDIPKKYKDEDLNEIFRYQEEAELTQDEWYLMHLIKSEFNRTSDYVKIYLKKYEYQDLGEAGLQRVLGLLKEQYPYDVTVHPAVKSYEDVVDLTIYCDIEDDE